MFQFHMVRLKVSGKESCTGAGTFQFHMVRLKVVTGSVYGYQPTKFQFHMVRLKDSQARRRYFDSMFQFHMVRLKAGWLAVVIVIEVRFNSIWYD